MAEAFASLFEKAQLGDNAAQDAVYRLAFYRLKGIASALLRRERAGHTLQPTAVVNEVYLRLADQDEMKWQNRAQFFGIAAQMMRRILVSHRFGERAIHQAASHGSQDS